MRVCNCPACIECNRWNPIEDEDEDERIELYAELADLTRERCGPCYHPFSCCSAPYCESTIKHAREQWDTELYPTDHPQLPLMGPEGCIADPHLRPICTSFVCDKHLLADPDFAEEYWELRERLDELESKQFGRKRGRGPRRFNPEEEHMLKDARCKIYYDEKGNQSGCGGPLIPIYSQSELFWGPHVPHALNYYCPNCKILISGTSDREE